MLRQIVRAEVFITTTKGLKHLGLNLEGAARGERQLSRVMRDRVDSDIRMGSRD
jgi:hypothetical protein